MTALTIYGAGAIGGITGGALARAGHDVLLVDIDAEHVQAMNTDGLTVETATGPWHAKVRAVTPERLPSGLELVFLAVKSHHTAVALDTVVPRLAPHGVVVSLQNGLSEELIAERIGPARTVGCLVNWAADWLGPGRIQHGGTGAFVLGELSGEITPRVKDLAGLLSPVAPTGTTDNLWGCKWSKHIYGGLLFATALVDAHVYDVVERSLPVKRTLARIVTEGMAVAEAAGVTLVAFDEFDPAWYRAAAAGDGAALEQAMTAIAAHYRAHTKTKTGIWRDLVVRRRKTEVDGQIGATVVRADRLGVPVPVTRRLVELIRDVESGQRPMAWETLGELVALAEHVR